MKFVGKLYKSPLDERDWLMTTFLEDKPMPLRFDLTDKMTPARHQGNEGSCAGFAMAVGVKE